MMDAAGLLFVPRLAATFLAKSCLEWLTCVIWAWMLYSYRMLSKHERYYGLGMDALVIVCSRNTNVIMVWAWML